MENWIYTTLPTLAKVLITVLIIFTIIIVITRVSGLRTFAKMSSFDFASTIAIGSILASVIMNTNQSIAKGALALVGIIVFQSAFAFAVRKSKTLQNLFTNAPLLLMYQGEILEDNLDKANVGKTDLIAKLREANVLNYNEVLAVVLESTGDMSVLHSSQESKLQDELLKDVIGYPRNS